MTETLYFNLLSVCHARRQLNIFFDKAPLHPEALTVSAGLPDDAASPVALFAPLPDPIVANHGATATALIASAWLAPLLSTCALARNTDHPLVHFHLL